MILTNPNVTDLSAGHALIEEFMATLDSTWLPGFERSYVRRTAEYEEALEKHENRGLFLRTLLKKPKKPNRPAPDYKETTGARLREAWHESFKTSPPPPPNSTAAFLQEALDDHYLAVMSLQLQADLAAAIVVVGPPGVIVAAEADNGRDSQSALPPAEQQLQQAAILIKGLVQESERPDTPVQAGRLPYWRQNLAELTTQGFLKEEEVFSLTDRLLARQQELSNGRLFSALSTAEKLTEREKDNLLRMAATL